MSRGHSAVPGIHSLQHIDTCRVTYLTDDDAVRAHSKRCFYQVSDRDPVLSLHIGIPDFKPYKVGNALDLKFCGIFYGYYSFVFGNIF